MHKSVQKASAGVVPSLLQRSTMTPLRERKVFLPEPVLSISLNVAATTTWPDGRDSMKLPIATGLNRLTPNAAAIVRMHASNIHLAKRDGQPGVGRPFSYFRSETCRSGPSRWFC